MFYLHANLETLFIYFYWTFAFYEYLSFIPAILSLRSWVQRKKFIFVSILGWIVYKLSYVCQLIDQQAIMCRLKD